MGSTSFNFFSDSPTMILSPQEPPHPFVDHSSFHQPDTHLLTPNNFSQWTPSSSRTPVYTAPSQKRSRDESALAEHDYFQDGSYFPRTLGAPPTASKHEAIYGEGMTLLNPTTGIAISAESQTGTWFEEEEAAKLAQIPHPSSSATSTSMSTANPTRRIKPALSSRKSQRLDTTAPGLDDISLSTLSSQLTGRSPPKSTTLDPTVDDSTHLLGIGWTRLRSDDDAVAAARGWAKYINNHYPGVRDAQILLQSKGLNAYLVAASEGFYLFKEDLSEGRLVGRSWETCLANLRAVSMGFEGGEVLRAVRMPEGHHGSGSSVSVHDGYGALGGGMDLD